MKKLHEGRDAIIYDLLGIENKKLKKKLLATLNLDNLKKEMKRSEFPQGLVTEMLTHFNHVIDEHGENGFSEWMYNLHYQVPEPYQTISTAENVYTKYEEWVEGEIVKLESETKLSWQEQSADLTHVSIEARKAQLVLRQRISDLVLNISDSAD